MDHVLLQVAIGSHNPVKIAAVRSALVTAGLPAVVTQVVVPSGVPEQPIGFAQTAEGARNRARAARDAQAANWGIGLEAGVEFDADGNGWLYGVVAIATDTGQETVAQGGKLLLPPVVARRVRAGEELGPVMDSLTGVENSKQKLGAVGFLTGGIIQREDSFREVVGLAMAPLLHPSLYASEP